MGLMTNYLMTTKNLDDVLKAVIHAQPPEKFTQKFLKDLGFTSTNDRLYIGLFKGLGLLNEASKPTDLYYRFLDESEAPYVLASMIRDAYEDLFALNRNAQEMSPEEVKNKFRTLTQGQKSDNVLTLMANTFSALTQWADWGPAPDEIPDVDDHAEEAEFFGFQPGPAAAKSPSLHYNIQVHLPESRDPAVYDAIFQSLRRHLL